MLDSSLIKFKNDFNGLLFWTFHISLKKQKAKSPVLVKIRQMQKLKKWHIWKCWSLSFNNQVKVRPYNQTLKTKLPLTMYRYLPFLVFSPSFFFCCPSLASSIYFNVLTKRFTWTVVGPRGKVCLLERHKEGCGGSEHLDIRLIFTRISNIWRVTDSIY